MLLYRPEFYSKCHLPYPTSVIGPSTCIVKSVDIIQGQGAFRVDEQPEDFHKYLAESWTKFRFAQNRFPEIITWLVAQLYTSELVAEIKDQI